MNNKVLGNKEKAAASASQSQLKKIGARNHRLRYSHPLNLQISMTGPSGAMLPSQSCNLHRLPNQLLLIRRLIRTTDQR